MAHHSVWGPSGLIVEQVVRRAATLTDDERSRLRKAWEAEPAEVDAAWGVVTYVARHEGRDMWRAGFDAGDAAGSQVEAGAVRDAAVAAVVSDLVGTLGLTAAHVDALMGPWLQVIGDPRVDPVCGCEPAPVTIDLGGLAPQAGDRFPWLVMAVVDEPEPLILGYAVDAADALRMADEVDGPAILWRAGKETP